MGSNGIKDAGFGIEVKTDSVSALRLAWQAGPVTYFLEYYATCETARQARSAVATMRKESPLQFINLRRCMIIPVMSLVFFRFPIVGGFN